MRRPAVALARLRRFRARRGAPPALRRAGTWPRGSACLRRTRQDRGRRHRDGAARPRSGWCCRPRVRGRSGGADRARRAVAATAASARQPTQCRSHGAGRRQRERRSSSRRGLVVAVGSPAAPGPQRRPPSVEPTPATTDRLVVVSARLRGRAGAPPRSGRPARRRGGPPPTPGRRAGGRARPPGPGPGRRPVRAAAAARSPRANRSKIERSSGTPGPLSSTAIHTCLVGGVAAAGSGARRHAVAPSAYVAALSIRLATTRARRRLSQADEQVLEVRVRTDGNGAWQAATPGSTSVTRSQVVEVQADRPGVEAGDLEQVLHQALEADDVGDQQVERAWARSGISSRRACITSTLAARVISGERSSWLTSLANRASRSTRACSAAAMSLNALASTRRSGSSVRSRAGCRGGRRRWPARPARRRRAGARRPAGRSARAARRERGDDGGEEQAERHAAQRRRRRRRGGTNSK